MASALDDLIASICDTRTQPHDAIIHNPKGRVGTRRSAQNRHAKLVNWATKFLKAPQNQRVRVNQFEIDERYQGLAEKFFVLNREDLSTALEDRIQKLGSHRFEGYIPEILALLLELEDEPLVGTDIDDLSQVGPGKEDESIALRWEDIVHEDGLSDEDLWKDDLGLNSSEDDESLLSSSPVTPAKSQPRSIVKNDEPDAKKSLQSMIVSTDNADLTKVEASVDVLKFSPQSGLHFVSETFVVREILSVLRGLSSALFVIHDPPSISVSPQIHACRTISLTSPSLNELLTEYATLATSIHRTRLWTRQLQQHAVLQRFQSSVSQVLNLNDKSLTNYEIDIVRGSSINGLLGLELQTQPLQRIIPILEAICRNLWNHDNDVALLDDLHKTVCALDSSEMAHEYSTLRTVFETTLEAYLRPLSHWMTEGVLLAQNNNLLIVVQSIDETRGEDYMTPSTLRRTIDGEIIAPHFISPRMAEKILSAGQSIRILKTIGLTKEDLTSKLRTFAFPGSDNPLELLSFPQGLERTLNRWINEHSSTSSHLFRNHLWSTLRLARYLDALELIYFSRDGSIFHAITQTIFSSMDRQRHHAHRRTWNDTFSLAETFRDALSTNAAIDVSRITVERTQILSSQSKFSSVHMSSLAGFRVNFRLPWLINLIVPSLTTHQQIFALLLQINRAKSILASDKMSLRARHAGNSASLRTHQRLLWFTDVLNAYIFDDVLAPNSQAMRHSLFKAEELNTMIESHTGFLSRIEGGCLLAKRFASIHQAVLQLLELSWYYRNLRNEAITTASARNITIRSKRARGRTHVLKEDSESPSDTDEDLAEAEEDGGQSEADYDADSERHRSRNGLPAKGDNLVIEEHKPETMQDIDREFRRLLRFVIAGLRGIGVSTNPDEALSHALLADRLQWGSENVK